MNAEIQHFFELLYPDVHDGWLVISWPDPYALTAQGTHPLVSQWVPLRERRWPELAQGLMRFTPTRNLYFGVAIQHPDCEPHRSRRGRSTSAYILPGLWADIDIATGQHAASTLPALETEALDFLGTLPQFPSLLLRTGGGLHAYWLFPHPSVLAGSEDLAAMAQVSTRFARFLMAEGHRRGWTLDNVGDLARTLRPAGTMNHKYGTVVTIIHEGAERYTPHDFAWLPPLPAAGPRDPNHAPLSGLPDVRAVAEAYGAVLHQKSATELAGAHPQHGSSTGTNFHVNVEKQLWHCWRHGTAGGDALTLIAVCEGWLRCEEAQSGCVRGDLFKHVVTHANTHLGASIALWIAGPQNTSPSAIVHHVVPDYILQHPDPRVREHWKRVYRRTAILKQRRAGAGALL